MLTWLLRLLGFYIATWLFLVGAWISYWLPMTITTRVGSFEIEISREADNDAEHALISVAEALCPSPELLRRCAQSAPDTDCVWWCGEYSGVRLPIAVTEDALAYYADFARAMEAEQQENFLHRPGNARLEYLATVAQPTDDRDGASDIVSLRLEWSHYCGSGFCGTRFEITRTVKFDESGTILSVTGDGPVDYVVY